MGRTLRWSPDLRLHEGPIVYVRVDGVYTDSRVRKTIVYCNNTSFLLLKYTLSLASSDPLAEKARYISQSTATHRCRFCTLHHLFVHSSGPLPNLPFQAGLNFPIDHCTARGLIHEQFLRRSIASFEPIRCRHTRITLQESAGKWIPSHWCAFRVCSRAVVNVQNVPRGVWEWGGGMVGMVGGGWRRWWRLGLRWGAELPRSFEEYGE
jgi:hypothetical protein